MNRRTDYDAANLRNMMVDPMKLHLHGCRIDEVIKVIPLESLIRNITDEAWRRENNCMTPIKHIARLTPFISPQNWPTGEPVEPAVMRTLCADQFPVSEFLVEDERMTCFPSHNQRNLESACFSGRPNADVGPQTEGLPDLEPYNGKESIAEDEDVKSLYTILFRLEVGEVAIDPYTSRILPFHGNR
ncbi:uncharacterized protein BDZ99DRAFT_516078 [Mytilinidion resinicola]|uniref:Uncharacterized protein n=1 Tax=Mytilinidion resinicola TaxID=574789 RepID=A0A6A6Z587_9PEZI|nr:uncharacterized protein BDZ99DRAFT_516078 [Mytilinidion resinicola]KAF2815345.1 hypothetical protein BDZ99DRAFT_516078 [Mytilinidion resinicola]